jgi:hypothetical protein
MRSQAKDCKVIALGGTAREYDFFRLASDHFGNLRSSMFNRILRSLSINMGATA